MARITDLKLLKRPGSCRIFRYKSKTRAICKGAIGVLTASQAKYIKNAKPASRKIQKIKRHWIKFQSITKKCRIKATGFRRPKKGKIFRKCMAKEAKKAGIRF